MRDYLQDIEIVGSVMCYQEREQCRWSLDWLYANCDRVCILLDNWDEKTKSIVLEYKSKYPDITHVVYSNEAVRPEKNLIAGQVKRRFKNRQPQIRQHVVEELKVMHKEKPIDILVWLDSDEILINQFGEILTEFWSRTETYMMLGFIEPFDDFTKIVSQKMAPHGRVFKYDPELSAVPWRTRTRYLPYYPTRPWKVRNVVLHLCNFTEEYRKKRRFFENSNEVDLLSKVIWYLPKDVRDMTVYEISEYQPGPHGVPAKHPFIPLQDYLISKK